MNPIDLHGILAVKFFDVDAVVVNGLANFMAEIFVGEIQTSVGVFMEQAFHEPAVLGQTGILPPFEEFAVKHWIHFPFVGRGCRTRRGRSSGGIVCGRVGTGWGIRSADVLQITVRSSTSVAVEHLQT